MFCAKCLIEMRCKKTGVIVRWRKEYAINGDLFSCSQCGAEVIKMAKEGYELTRDIVPTTVFEVPE